MPLCFMTASVVVIFPVVALTRLADRLADAGRVFFSMRLRAVARVWPGWAVFRCRVAGAFATFGLRNPIVPVPVPIPGTGPVGGWRGLVIVAI